jgi:hypothetical protein
VSKSIDMCSIIIINRGEKQIETPNEFKEHFGFLPLCDSRYGNFEESELNDCLCVADLPTTFREHKIPYKEHIGDYYVGDLENVKDFDYHYIPLNKNQ